MNIKLTIALSLAAFTTVINGQVCDTFQASYNQGFELFVLGGMGGDTTDCWHNTNDVNPMWTVEDGMSTTGLTGPSGPYAGLQYLFLESSSPASAGQADTLTSPVINISSLMEAQLSFYYHMHGLSMGTLRFEASGDGGFQWDSLGVFIGEQHTMMNSAWSQKIVPLNYEDSVMVRFIGIRGINFYSDMALDEIKIEESSECTAPTSLLLLSRTDTSATISWIAGDIESDWIISHGNIGFVPGDGMLIHVNDTFHQLNGLSGEYDAYVRSICPSGDTSSWFGPISWTTAPVNFQCQNGRPIACDSMLVDSTYDAVEQTNLPHCATAPGAYGLWYSYQGDGHLVTISTDDVITNFDTKINVYTGYCKTPICETGDDDGGSNSTSLLSFPTKLGEIYHIYVSGFSTNQGIYQLSVSCEDCFTPVNPIVTVISDDSVNVSWTSPIGSTGYVMEYGESGYLFGSGNRKSTGSSGGPIGIPGLSASTVYEFYLWENCNGSNTDTIGPIPFETACREEVPYSQPFVFYKPDCWEEADFGNPQSGPMSFGVSSWGNDLWLNDMSHPNGNSARINLFFIHSDWLFSPVFNLLDTFHALSFEIASTEYNDVIPAEWPSSDTLKLLYSDDDGLTWNEMFSWDTLSPPSNLGDSLSFPISSASGLMQFAFWASTSGIDSPGDIEIFIDNFEIKLKANLSPVASCSDTSLYLDQDGFLVIESLLINDGNSVGLLSLSRDSFMCENVGSNAVTLYASTALGIDSCTSTLTVIDTINPQVDCSDSTYYLPLNNLLLIDENDFPLTTTDNCGIDSFWLSVDSFFESGSYANTIYAFDESGNSSFCNFEVTVIDTFIDPEAHCQDITIYLDNCGMANLSPSSIDSGSIGSLTISQSMFKCEDLGLLDIILFASTNAGIDTCVTTALVLDTFAPSVSCHNAFLILGSNNLAIISQSDWLDGVNDNCAIDKINLSQDTFTLADVGILYDTVTVEDASGNVAHCVFEVAVSAMTDPCFPLVEFTGSQVQGAYYADTIQSAAQIESQDHVIYIGATLCTFEGDFEVELGAEFTVIMQPCD